MLKYIIVGIELLIRFGKAVLNEMTEMFARGSNVVIPFTQDSIKDICSIYGFDYEEVAESFRVEFKRCRAIDPYYSLACCTFQVMIAYDCLALGERAYNCELTKFIRTSVEDFDVNCLHQVYSEEGYPDYSARKQEQLWENSQKLLKSEGLNLWIPDRGSNTGRYVQYPQKQRIIKRNTLEDYIAKFKNRFDTETVISYSFNDFSTKLFRDSDDLYARIRKEKQSDLSEIEALNIAKRIIFYCYCNWVEREVQKRGPYKKVEKDSYKIRLSDDKFNILKNDTEVKSYSEVILFRPFTYDETYDEWVLSYSDIDHTDNVIIGVLLDRTQWKNNSLLSGAAFFEWSCSPNLRFYINPVKFIERREKEWFKKDNIKFIGGVKDNDGRWILSLLPTITNIKKQNTVIIDHKSYLLDNGSFDLNSVSDKMGAGIHFIKLLDRAPISFETVAPGKISVSHSGWKWKRRNADFWVAEGNDVVLSGLYTNVLSCDEHSVSHWGNMKIERLNDKYSRIDTVSVRRGWN